VLAYGIFDARNKNMEGLGPETPRQRIYAKSSGFLWPVRLMLSAGATDNFTDVFFHGDRAETMTSSRNHSAQSRSPLRSPAGTTDTGRIEAAASATEQAAQLSAASAVLQRSLERLAKLSDVRLLVSEVLTSIIEVAGADGGALLRYVPTTHTLVLQSYVLDGLVLDIANSERLAQKQEVMPAESFPHWNDILGATDTFFAYNDCGVHPALPEVAYSHRPMNSAGLALRRGDTIIGLLVLVYDLSEELPAERIRATRTLTRYAALVLELAWLADESREAAVIRTQAKAAEERAAESARAMLGKTLLGRLGRPEAGGEPRAVSGVGRQFLRDGRGCCGRWWHGSLVTVYALPRTVSYVPARRLAS
jgi:hypothetical protein